MTARYRIIRDRGSYAVHVGGEVVQRFVRREDAEAYADRRNAELARWRGEVIR